MKERHVTEYVCEICSDVFISKETATYHEICCRRKSKLKPCEHRVKVYTMCLERGDGDVPIAALIVRCAVCDEDIEIIDLFDVLKDDMAFNLYKWIKEYK